jgi:hypothetical protein
VLIEQQDAFNEIDTVVFTAAGNELAQLAIGNPGKYLGVLQGLKNIENNTGRTLGNYKNVQQGLWSALPKAKEIPGARNGFTDEINSLFLKQLETHD